MTFSDFKNFFQIYMFSTYLKIFSLINVESVIIGFIIQIKVQFLYYFLIVNILKI